MSRYKVMGMNRGSASLIKAFANRAEAEAFVRMTQRSTKHGTVQIVDSNAEERKQPGATAAGHRPAPALRSGGGAPGRTRVASTPPLLKIGGIALGILICAAVLIELLNSALSRV